MEETIQMKLIEKANYQPFANIGTPKKSNDVDTGVPIQKTGQPTIEKIVSLPFANVKPDIQKMELPNAEKNVSSSHLLPTPTPPSPAPTPPINFVPGNDISFENQVKKYISTHNPKLYILTPFYGGMCHLSYLMSLIETIEVFQKYNFPLQIDFCRNDSLVPRARNNLIAKAMTDPDATHMIFIDSDIHWTAIDILKLVLDDKPIIGGVYPLKKYEWGALLNDPGNPYNSNVVQSIIDKKNASHLKNIITDENMLQCNLLKYNLNYLGNILQIENNVAKVRHVATGFMMIQRDTIQKLMDEHPKTKYTDDIGFLAPEENKWAYALFDCAVEDNHYFSEDWLFCHRWTKMGNDVFVDVSINLTHTGPNDFKGCLLASLI